MEPPFVKVASVRIAAKELARSHLVGLGVQDGRSMPPLCPEPVWQAVAPSLVQGATGSLGGDSGNGTEAPCVSRAERVRTVLEEAIDLKPELEAAKERTAELVSRRPQLLARPG